jgi:hypothetical protein
MSELGYIAVLPCVDQTKHVIRVPLIAEAAFTDVLQPCLEVRISIPDEETVKTADNEVNLLPVLKISMLPKPLWV